MITIKIPKTQIKRKFTKYAKEIDFTIAATINKSLFETKNYMAKAMDQAYEGGATRFTKQQIQYTKATKQMQHGVLYVRRGGDYIIPTLDGGKIKPFPNTVGLIQPLPENVRLSKQGNLRRGYVKSKETNPKFFIGYPKGRPRSPKNYGLWRRTGRKGREGLNLEVKMSKKSRVQTRVFNGRMLARIYAQEMFNKYLVPEMARAALASELRKSS